MSVNKANILGNVGNDPKIGTLKSGDKVARFSVATSESWKDKTTGEKKTATEWHNIVVFGKLAEIVEKYVFKGQQLYIEGKIKTRSWDDKEVVKKYITEIVLSGLDSKLDMIGGRKEEIHGNAEPSNIEPDPVNNVDPDEDLPF